MKDVWLEISEHFTALEKVRIINHILFDVHGFGRNKSRLMAPQNSFICDVLDTRKGNPISLSVIYSLVAQRLGLPVYGVNLPRNFLLAYLDDSALSNKELFSNPQSVLFYINPINKGAVLGRKEIDSFIQQQKLEPDLSLFVPCSNKDTVRRLFKNLLFAYEGMGLPLKCAEIKEFIAILDE
jgi:regulator of sirC expression with transglutaminase-like and TPR domain